MEFKNVGHNDPCPCGSGKKYKHCHLGRESEFIEAQTRLDVLEAAEKIRALPRAEHPQAALMAATLDLRDRRDRPVRIELVDLDAYLSLDLGGPRDNSAAVGGMVINPSKTEKLDPQAVYLALHPDIGDSELVHLLAHVVDLVSGSRLPLGHGLELAARTNLPLEFLEHPQEFGDALVQLADRFGVRLDAENEVIAFLARARMLLPGEVLATQDQAMLERGVSGALMFLKDNQETLDAILKTRAGYTGASAPKKSKAKKKKKKKGSR